MTPWKQHVAQWSNCTKCLLCKQRRKIVLGRGTLPCKILFVGEAPGTSEDILGSPFVGPAGILFDELIERAGVQPGTFAMTNLVACFPREAKRAGINEPPVEAIRACQPRLDEFIAMAQAKITVAVGALAAKHLRAFDVQVMHPAAILRQLDAAQRPLAKKRVVVTLAEALDGV